MKKKRKNAFLFSSATTRNIGEEEATLSGGAPRRRRRGRRKRRERELELWKRVVEKFDLRRSRGPGWCCCIMEDVCLCVSHVILVIE